MVRIATRMRVWEENKVGAGGGPESCACGWGGSGARQAGL